MFRIILSRRSLVALILPLLLAACGEPVATPEPAFVQASGAEALGPVIQDLAAAFHEQSPTVNLEVTALGTQFGLDALRAGEADVAFASWLPDAGQGMDPAWRRVVMARDGIAIVVHPDNPVDGLGLLQLTDLFGGRTQDWGAVAGRLDRGVVQLVSREEGSGTRAAFEALVMGEEDVPPLAVMVTSGQAVVDYVAENPDAIGYVSMSEIGPEVKVLTIEGEKPSPESAGQGSYPLSHEFWLVTADPAPEAVQAFVDFVLSPAGQQIVGQHLGQIR